MSQNDQTNFKNLAAFGKTYRFLQQQDFVGIYG